MTTDFNWSWVETPDNTANESGSVLQDGGTVYSLRQASNGQINSSDLSAFSTSVGSNFQTIRGNWRNYTRPILNSLPAGGRDSRWSTDKGKALPDKIDCFKYGVQGSTLFVFNDATSAKADGRYWVSDEYRPKTIAEAIEDLHVLISGLSDELAVETVVDLDPLWAAIGEDYRDGTKVGSAGSLDNRVTTTEGYINRLNVDIYEPSTYAYSISNPLPFSIANMLDELLQLHGTTGWGDDPSGVSHDNFLLESDLSTLVSYIGMTDINTPPGGPQYSSINYISNGDDLTVAIGKLDTAIAGITPGSGGAFEIETGITGSAKHSESTTTTISAEFGFATGNGTIIDTDSEGTAALGGDHTVLDSEYSVFAGKQNFSGLTHTDDAGGTINFTASPGETEIVIPSLQLPTYDTDPVDPYDDTYGLRGTIVVVSGATSAANNGTFRILRQDGEKLYINNDAGVTENGAIGTTVTWESGDYTCVDGFNNFQLGSDNATIKGKNNVAVDADHSLTTGYFALNHWHGAHVHSNGPMTVGSSGSFQTKTQTIKNIVYSGYNTGPMYIRHYNDGDAIPLRERRFRFGTAKVYSIRIHALGTRRNMAQLAGSIDCLSMQYNLLVANPEESFAPPVILDESRSILASNGTVDLYDIAASIETEVTPGEDGADITEYFLGLTSTANTSDVCWSADCQIIEIGEY